MHLVQPRGHLTANGDRVLSTLHQGRDPADQRAEHPDPSTEPFVPFNVSVLVELDGETELLDAALSDALLHAPGGAEEVEVLLFTREQGVQKGFSLGPIKGLYASCFEQQSDGFQISHDLVAGTNISQLSHNRLLQSPARRPARITVSSAQHERSNRSHPA